MDFKKKLKTRLYIAVSYIILGIMIIGGTFAFKLENEFISSLGLILAVVGIVRMRNYFRITKSEERIRKQEIAETDERNVWICYKARSVAFVTYILISGVAVIVLLLLDMHEAAKWIAYSLYTLIAVYWIAYIIYQKKL